MTSEEKPNELHMLKRKREPGCFYTKIDHDIFFQKEKEFPIINSNLENLRQINESINDKNKIKPDPNNNEIKNLKKLLSESSNNLKQKEINKPKIFIDNKEGNLLNNSSAIRNPSTKLKYFNVEKNIIKKSIINFNNNNEIKIFKNKK